ncbi:hypothetical protein J437_LFUL013642 [Ladona fulva]|uniref:Uncharacterized protein n=1 Tax=Ladona fulva TaxID=123851 RepID=A0A8K0KL69_LADFU|nr:hypothetical protein J437_LFUL013642 [Ladona fulva]
MTQIGNVIMYTGKSSEGGKDSPDKETPKPKNKTPPKTVDPSKTKWKSFRNNFEKETNSNPIDHSEDSACGHQPKWDYFKSPLMMRETLSSRMEESLEIETVVPEVDDKVNEEISAVSIESIFEDEGDDIQLIDAVSENTNLDSQESGITSLSIDLNTDHSNFDNDRDPYSYDNKNMQVTQEEEDDDLHFFKSLLPFMKKRLEPNERRSRLWRINRRKKIMRAAP